MAQRDDARVSLRSRRPIAAQQLDCRGMFCPLPALETRKALADLAPGAVLEVTCTDPASEIDLRALCDETGDELVDLECRNGLYRFWIRARTAG